MIRILEGPAHYFDVRNGAEIVDLKKVLVVCQWSSVMAVKRRLMFMTEIQQLDYRLGGVVLQEPSQGELDGMG